MALRFVNNIRKSGFKEYWKQLNTIGDSKSGILVGTDKFGNRYYENLDEVYGRERFVMYASPDYDASQIPCEWHSWMQKVTDAPVKKDFHQPFCAEHQQNFTGTRGAFKTYSTVKPAFNSWIPVVRQRSTA